MKRPRADLESAAGLIGPQPVHADAALFHCRQAAEKAWTAFLFWNDVPFRQTHDWRELGAASTAVDASLAELAERAEDLTAFAWVFRYPGAREEPTAEQAEEALGPARQVFAAVAARLPEKVRP